VRAAMYADIIDRVKRRVIMTPLFNYMLKTIKFYKYQQFRDNGGYVREFTQFAKRKVSRAYRITVDNFEYRKTGS